jgi:antitoxin (DNA-binding transcriptional repressor) of toxin-antitoxin stability system
MSTISIDQIRRDIPGFLRRLEAGETLLVVEDDRAVAEIRPVPASPGQPRPFGLCAGQFTVPDDFDGPLPEHILRDWDGR